MPLADDSDDKSYGMVALLQGYILSNAVKKISG